MAPAAAPAFAAAALRTLAVEDRHAAAATYLRGVAAAALGRSVVEIGLDRPLAALGLDSLSALEIRCRAEADLGVDLALGRIFAASSLAELADDVLAGLARQRPAAPPLEACAGALSRGQEALWFLHEMAPESAVYNVSFAARLLAPIPEKRLRRLFDALVARHPMLRSTFHDECGRPVRRVAPPGPSAFTVIAAADWPPALLTERLAEEAHRPFDLARGPLFRALLFRRPEEPVLLVAAHHIAVDFWSMEVLCEELRVLAGGAAAARPPASTAWEVYVEAQRTTLAGAEGERLRRFWVARLTGLPPLALPADHPRPQQPSFHGAALPVRLDVVASSELAGYAGTRRVTPFALLLALFQVLLHRWSGQEDLAVGSPVAGRGRAEWQGVVGYFVNMLVLRADLSGGPSLDTFLERVRASLLAAFDHQDFPFPVLVEELQPVREPALPPLFQAAFVLHRPRAPVDLTAFPLGDEEARIDLGSLALAPVAVPPRASPFDLTLTLARRGDRLAGTLQYSRDLFEPATAARLVGHLENLLAAAPAMADRPLGELPLLSPGERHQLLREWNDTAGAAGELPPLAAAFARQVRRRPQAVAVACGQEHLSYGELDRRAGRLARRLRSLGVGPESRVGLALPRSLDLVLGLLGIVQAGGAYVPLDPGLPPERRALLLADLWTRGGGGERVVLARGDPAGALGGVRIVDPASPDGPVDEPAAGSRTTGVGPDHLAYVMYTSGSTGRPKGVAVPQRAVARLVLDTAYVELTASDRVAQASTASFDAATFEIWGALLNGGCLVVLPPGVLSVEHLGREVERSAVTVLWLTAGLFHQMVEECLEALSGLRYLLAGGDVLSPAHVAQVRRRLPDCRLRNGYGPTEGTTFTCCHAVEDGDGSSPVPIGRPISRTRVHVLDGELRPVPAGVAGELCAGGQGLARGYWSSPERTAESFVPDGVSGEAGGRLYRTGDRARWRGDGAVDFLGRLDRQVKVRGFRVEPSEVEAVLATHPQVREAAVDVRDDPAGGHRLVGYVVPTEDAALDLAALRRIARELLPEYMVPAQLVLLVALPLNANGKVDRRALPDPAEEAIAAIATAASPCTPVEELLVGIWCEVLEVARVGPGDNFFDLGGHSLLATRLVSRLREALGIELPIAELWAVPVLGDLAHVVERLLPSAPPPPAPLLPGAAEDGRAPLSFAQERLWLLDRLEPGTPVYNVPAAAHLTGPLTVAALGRALSEIVRRHHALRTTFREVDGEARQEVAPAAPFRLPVVDLGGLAPARRDGAARDLAGEEARRGFELARGPLFRATLVRLGGREHLLLLNTHHIVFDGWSLGIFARELAALYEAFREGRREPPLPELPVQYADFAVWQRRALADATLDGLLGFWRERLAGAPVAVDLPTDRPRPPRPGQRGTKRRFLLPAALAGALRELGRRHGATRFMILLAAWEALLHRHTAQADLVLGTPVAGRGASAVENLVGFFVNTLVLRTDAGGDPPFHELLARVRAGALAAYGHQDLPFARLVEALEPQRDPGRNPLFNVMFNLRTPLPALMLPELTVRVEEIYAGVSRFDLTLAMEETPGGLAGSLEYSTDLFDGVRIERLCRHLAALLAGAAADPESRLSALPLLGAAERHQLLVEEDATVWDGPDATAHELFAAQARRTPEAVAVCEACRALSYGELARRSSRLARGLGDLGAGRGRPVAVVLEPGPGQVVALLAVLEAGGFFLCLDPTQHPARLAQVLGEARAAAVLVDGGVLRERRELLRDCQQAWGSRVVGIDLPPGPPEAAADGLRVERPGGHLGAAGRGSRPADPAYLVYTSGSTGRPKGILQSHRSFCQYVDWRVRRFAIGPGARLLQWASLTYDAAYCEIFGALCSGATLAMAEPAVRYEPESLLRWAADEQATHLKFVPSFSRQVVERLGERGGAAPALPHVRFVELAGELLPVDLAAAWRRRLGPGVRLFNMYGPSEMILATWQEVGEVAPGQRTVGIGRAIGGRHILVLDPRGGLCPLGVRGEIHVRSPYLALGYFERPEETAGSFLTSPLSPADALPCYRTGDFGWRRSDGALEFAGRRDQQVKVRGMRVELGEIEAVLGGHGEVRECAVVARDSGADGVRLVAYLEASGAAEPARLHAFLRERLPAALVPAEYVFLRALPRTRTGKVDRRALPDPAGRSVLAGSAYVAPRTSTETTLAEIFAELLAVPRVGAEDSFFALGGHSLLATRVLARVRAAFGVEIPLRRFFDGPTVAELAAAMAERRLAACDEGEMARLLRMLEHLSEEQAREILASDTGPRPHVDP